MKSRYSLTLGVAATILWSLPELRAGTLTVATSVELSNPDILAYNVGHFVAGSNTHDWWRYAGVNGARLFLSPSTIEPTDDIPGTGDGVTNQASFLSRKTALRADPLNTSYINWPTFENLYENELTGSSSTGNRFTTNYAMTKLRELGISVLVNITASESSLPIANSSDWAGKWELWQHFYAQAYYLGRHFDVERYQMFNEPNHSNADGLTSANWLMRLQLASDAIQSALADVNASYGKSLTPLVYAPVNSGGNTYGNWGSVGVKNRHTNFLGVTDPNYLVMHRYDYHEYNSTPAEFGSSLDAMKTSIAAEMAPETRFRMSISEFNVHTNGNFDTIPETMNDNVKYARFGDIAATLAKKFEKDLYCFKFAQTGNPGGNYPISKNGMHYVQNAAPYNYGGVTQGAEVWRLFNKALAPGGQQLNYTRDSDGSINNLNIRATYRSDTGNYYVFCVNNNSTSINLTIDTSAWNIPAGTFFLHEEVSSTRFGNGRTWDTVAANGRLSNGAGNVFAQPAYSVSLYTIPGSAQQTELVIDAIEDATVIDGTNASTNYGSATALHARNDPASANNRKATFLQFKVPVIFPGDIQLAVLSLNGKTNTSGTTVQAHVYGIEDDSWTEETLTWSNAPNLLKSTAAGKLIANRVISGQGDTAQILGQIAASSTTNALLYVDVTDFLQKQSDQEISILVSQDPRWDVTLPSLVAGDTQVDGLEFQSKESSGTAPRLRIVRHPDTDGDGISDQAETNVFSTNPALADTDSDGQTDGEEVFAGSNPNDPTSRFIVHTFERISGGHAKLSWQSLVGRDYVVLRSTTLLPDSWTRLTVLPGTGSTLTFTDMSASGLDKAFYSIQVQ